VSFEKDAEETEYRTNESGTARKWDAMEWAAANTGSWRESDLERGTTAQTGQVRAGTSGAAQRC
jgi:hypothetical protein